MDAIGDVAGVREIETSYVTYVERPAWVRAISKTYRGEAGWSVRASTGESIFVTSEAEREIARSRMKEGLRA
jgi:hypothetical protein